jgi:hypothetical protein
VINVDTPCSLTVPSDLFGAREARSSRSTPASQWSISQSVTQGSAADAKRQMPSTWTFNTINRSFPEQGCYNFLSDLLATRDSTFIGVSPSGTPITADHVLFPGNINYLPFCRDFLAQVDADQARTCLCGQYYEDRSRSQRPELCPDIQDGFFNKDTIDLLHREFLCGQELAPEDLQRGSTILVWICSLPTGLEHPY